MSNSFDTPLRTQQSYTEDELYGLHVFSYRRLTTNGGTGPRKQLIVFITRASEDSGQLDKLHKQLDQGMINVRSVYSNSFRWRKSEGTKLLAQLILGDFQAEKQVDRHKIDEMKLAENLIFTMPESDASFITMEATLMNESRDIILQTGELNLQLSIFQGETRPGVENEHEGNQPIEMEA